MNLTTLTLGIVQVTVADKLLDEEEQLMLTFHLLLLVLVVVVLVLLVVGAIGMSKAVYDHGLQDARGGPHTITGVPVAFRIEQIN
jgi:hypothetical protein